MHQHKAEGTPSSIFNSYLHGCSAQFPQQAENHPPPPAVPAHLFKKSAGILPTL